MYSVNKPCKKKKRRRIIATSKSKRATNNKCFIIRCRSLSMREKVPLPTLT